MRRVRLYCPELSVGTVDVPAQEAHHAGEVLRLRRGDEVVLFDGRGGEAASVIVDASRTRMTARVQSITTRPFELPVRLTLAVAMPRTPRQAYLIEKCTELGAAEFWPMVSERCVVRPSAASIHKWSRRAIEAAKQSHRAFVPIVQPPVSATEVWTRAKEFSASVICCLREGATSLVSILHGLGAGATLLACIGPEGGWTEQEEADAVAHGLRPVSLGPNILRIETAAAAVGAIVAQHAHRTDD